MSHPWQFAVANGALEPTAIDFPDKIEEWLRKNFDQWCGWTNEPVDSPLSVYEKLDGAPSEIPDFLIFVGNINRWMVIRADTFGDCLVAMRLIEPFANAIRDDYLHDFKEKAESLLGGFLDACRKKDEKPYEFNRRIGRAIRDALGL